MLNPQTGDVLSKGKPLILMYQLTGAQAARVRVLYAGDYKIEDVSDCFTDVLAVGAGIVFLNPHRLSPADFEAIDEVFAEDDDTAVVFTDEIAYPLNWRYHVEDNLENSERSWTNMYDRLEEERAYQKALADKDALLLEIDSLVSGGAPGLDGARAGISMRSRIATMTNNGLLYGYITRIIRQLNALSPKEKVKFRAKVNKELLLLTEKFAG